MPTKAIREHLESDGGDGFDYWLCLKLGWRSVAEMRRGMSALEWRTWVIHFAIEQQRQELANAREG